MKGSIALLVSGLAAQQVSATWNRHAEPYSSTPQYNNNECSDKQKQGFNWGDLKEGQKDFNYGDFNFGGGWTCANSFGKRDLRTKRTFQSKCIKNTVSKEKPASFDCGDKKKDGFSVDTIDISVDHDVDLDFHYKMEDGSTCKQKASCGKSGTTVQNTQCGGAKSVEVYLGNSSEGKDNCDIGIHHIGFDCNPGQTYTPPPAYTPVFSTPPPVESSTAPPPESSTAPPASYSAPPESSAPPPESSEVPPPPQSSAVYPSCGEGNGYNSTMCSSTAPPVESSTAPPATSSSPPESSAVTPPESSYVPVESSAVESSAAPPASSAAVSSYGAALPPTSSVEAITSAGPSSYGGEAPPSSAAPSTTPAASPSPSSYPTPPGGYTPPDVLPKCINTWLQIKTQCKDNTDASCYCKIPEFTDEVIKCVAAYGASDEASKALQYLIGICADDVPKNPGIVTNCPTYIPINPTTPAASAPPAETPVGSTYVPAPPAETPVGSTYVPAPPAETPVGSTYVPAPPAETPVGSSYAPAPPAETPVGSTYAPAPPAETPVVGSSAAPAPPAETPVGSGYAPAPPAETPVAGSTYVPAPPAETPVGSGYAPAPPAASAPPATYAPVAPAPSYPVTTISVGSSSYTVPQVAFTTQAPGAPGANPTEPIALVPANTPAPAPANPTGAPYPMPSGMTSVTYPTGSGALPSASAPSEFTGAASPLNAHVKGAGVVFGAVLAFFAL